MISRIAQAQRPTPTLDAALSYAQTNRANIERFSYGDTYNAKHCVYYEVDKLPIYVKWDEELEFDESRLMDTARALHGQLERDDCNYLRYPRYTKFLDKYIFTLPNHYCAVSWLRDYTFDEHGNRMEV